MNKMVKDVYMLLLTKNLDVSDRVKWIIGLQHSYGEKHETLREFFTKYEAK